MGVPSSLFGGAIGPALPVLEKAVGVLVLGFGLLLLADVNLFKRLTFLHRSGSAAAAAGRGSCSARASASSGSRASARCSRASSRRWRNLPGIDPDQASCCSLVYSLGFAVPMLAVGYGSQALRQRVRVVASHPVAVRWVSGLLLVALGVLILRKGMLFAGM